MKNHIFCTIITTFLISTVLFGEDDDQIVGIRAGFHSASMVKEGEKPDTAKSVSSIYIGFFRESKVAPLLYWGSGIEYFQNGYKYTNNSQRTLHTISIPLNLKLKVGPAFGIAGAAANFKVSENYEYSGSSYNSAESDKSNWFDIPVFLGAGVKILFISVEARYHWGLLEVRNGHENRYLQLGAALSF